MPTGPIKVGLEKEIIEASKLALLTDSPPPLMLPEKDPLMPSPLTLAEKVLSELIVKVAGPKVYEPEA